MQIALYNYYDKPNVVDKTSKLLNLRYVNGTSLLETFDEKNPSIRVSNDNSAELQENVFNYFMIDNKYYFVENIEHVSEKILIIHGKLDVLMTFKDRIKNMTCYIKRRTDGSTMIQDDMTLMKPSKSVYRIPISNRLDQKYDLFGDGYDGRYVLVTAQNDYQTVATYAPPVQG